MEFVKHKKVKHSKYFLNFTESNSYIENIESIWSVLTRNETQIKNILVILCKKNLMVWKQINSLPAHGKILYLTY